MPEETSSSDGAVRGTSNSKSSEVAGRTELCTPEEHIADVRKTDRNSTQLTTDSMDRDVPMENPADTFRVKIMTKETTTHQ